MEQLQNSVHIECEIQFASSRWKLGSEEAERCSWSQRHPGRTGVKNPPVYLQLQKTGDETGDPRVDATHGVETPTPLADR